MTASDALLEGDLVTVTDEEALMKKWFKGLNRSKIVWFSTNNGTG